VKIPSNYKDPAKIAAYANKRSEELHRSADKHSLAGSISRAVVIKDSKKVFDEAGLFVGNKFLDFIFKDSKLSADSTVKDHLLVVGCSMHTAIRMAALDYIAINGSLPFSLHWALELDPEFRYNRIPGFMDPVSVLAGSSTYGPTAVARRFKLPVDENDAESLAVLASQLAARLFP